MSERPVEEIIGWRLRDHGFAAPASVLPNWWTPGGPRYRAEVDDLAAWLTSRELLFSVSSQSATATPSGWDIHAWVVEIDNWSMCAAVAGLGNFEAEGPTIRDALIAAVRKVADG